MCGRYVLEAPEDLSERFQLRQLAIQLPHTWNVAPTNHLPVIVENDEGEREARLMQWGLIPVGPSPATRRGLRRSMRGPKRFPKNRCSAIWSSAIGAWCPPMASMNGRTWAITSSRITSPCRTIRFSVLRVSTRA